MILVLGETYDSLLGLRKDLGHTDALPSLVLDLPAFEGEIFGEKILGFTSGSTNYLSSLSAERAIATYHPDIVVYFGESASLSPRLDLGDIVVGNRIFIHGVNFLEQGLPYGSIPGLPSFYYSDIDLARSSEDVGMKIPGIRVLRGDILSGEKKIVNQEEFASIIRDRYAANAHLLAYDLGSGGIALTCKLHNIPFLPLKAITYLPLQGATGVMKERRISLHANMASSQVLIALLKSRKGGFHG